MKINVCAYWHEIMEMGKVVEVINLFLLVSVINFHTLFLTKHFISWKENLL